MLAVDTNIVVRYLVGDDALQTAKAKDLINKEEIFVPLTVLLETEWVLRDVYDFSNKAVMQALRAFAGLPCVTVEDAGRLARALNSVERGLDFADALHLASADQCEAFVTFDRALIKSAKDLRSCKVRVP